MKKTNILLISILASLVILSIFVIAQTEDTVPGLLSQILEKLSIIAEKETVVNVEVNPEVVIPEEECEWEKLNQMIYLKDNRGAFVLPDREKYSEVIFKKLYATYKCEGESRCVFMLNKPAEYDVNCVSIYPPTNQYEVYDITDTCLSELVEGTNTFSSKLFGATYGIGEFKEINVEMEVKPANC